MKTIPNHQATGQTHEQQFAAHKNTQKMELNRTTEPRRSRQRFYMIRFTSIDLYNKALNHRPWLIGSQFLSTENDHQNSTQTQITSPFPPFGYVLIKNNLLNAMT